MINQRAGEDRDEYILREAFQDTLHAVARDLPGSAIARRFRDYMLTV